MKRLLPLLLLLLSTTASAQSIDTLRVMTYNLLNYPGSSGMERRAHFARIFQATRPDIIVVQELVDIQGLIGILESVTTVPGKVYAGATHVDGPDTDPGFIFDTLRVDYFGVYHLETELRNIGEYHFSLKGHRDTIILFTCHLKAGDAVADRQQRQREALRIRMRMDTLIAEARAAGRGDTLFVIAGDLNVYRSSEDAYQTLLSSTLPFGSRVVDPINAPGVWSANPDFAYLHTQSPRVRQFEGGVVGGMDDRFDQILISPELMQNYVQGSYTAFGNDSKHFNDSINRLPNMAVPDSIANSLHAASDHLPVYADFLFGLPPAGIRDDQGIGISSLTILPQPASDVVIIRFQSAAAGSARLQLVDVTGKVVRDQSIETTGPEQHDGTIDVASLSPGVYGFRLYSGDRIQSGTLVVVR